MRIRSTAAAGLFFTAALSLGFSGTASAADLNCSDFASQEQAQAAYNTTAPADPNNLDRDGDGIACETLASGGSGQAEDGTTFGDAQVSTKPVGSVATGDGSSSNDGVGALPYALGGAVLTAAGGAAFAARRSSRASV